MKKFSPTTPEQHERAILLAALRPFVLAYRSKIDPGTADLYPEQPMWIGVTLGDCRKADLLMHALDRCAPPANPPEGAFTAQLNDSEA